MKKLLLFLTTLLLLANAKWANAVDEIDIGLYSTSCSHFEVRVSSTLRNYGYFADQRSVCREISGFCNFGSHYLFLSGCFAIYNHCRTG